MSTRFPILSLATESSARARWQAFVWLRQALACGVTLLVLASAGCERTASTSNASLPSSSGARQQERAFPGPAAALPPTGAPSAPRVPSYRTAQLARERGQAAPAKRYANLSDGACVAELGQRKLPVKPARGKTPGLKSPLQVVGPLRGVRFELPRTIYGFFDCRLVLLLDDLAAELNARGVVSVVVNNVYRPAATLLAKPRRARNPSNKAAGRKAGSERVRLSQHALGLAIDITGFRLADGRILNVEQDWRGAIAEQPCGPKSRVLEEHPAGVALRDLTCGIASAGYCNHLITPSRDEAHANHLHCDIEAGANEVWVE